VEDLKFEIKMLARKQKSTMIEPTNPDSLTEKVKKLEQEKIYLQDKND